MARLCALLVDLAGVLLMLESSPERRRWLNRLGLDEAGLYDAIFRHPLADDVFRGRLPALEFWYQTGARLGLSSGESEELYRDYYAGDRVNGPVASLVICARDHGLRTALLTNTYGDLEQLLERHGLLGLFDAVVNSAVEGVCKPDPAVYLLACARLGVQPEQALFIDDRQDNVEGAQRVGLQALRYSDDASVARAADVLGLPGFL